MSKQRELTYQNHIIDSFELHGGYAKKWASEWQAGPPDLVCASPGFGNFLIEVKHRPTWSEGKKYQNPLTDKQLKECRNYWKAGGNVMGAVVIGPKAIKSTLYLFPIQFDEISLDPSLSTRYVVGMKYDMRTVLRFWSTKYGWK